MNKLDKLHMTLMEHMNDEEKQAFREGLKALGLGDPVATQAFRESVQRLRPDFTPEQVNIVVAGKAPNTGSFFESSDEFWAGRIEQLALAYRELHPGESDEDVANWVTGHEGRAITMKSDSPAQSAQTIVLNLEKEDAEKAEEQAVPNALKAIHKDWSQEKVNEWMTQQATVLAAFKGLHPEWDAQTLVRAVLGDEEDN